MKRQHAVDVIRAELKRQRETGKVSIVETSTPDSYTVIGIIDVYEVARAIEEATSKK